MSGSTKRDKDKTQPIQVYVRVRPLNRQEREARSFSCIEVVNSNELLVKQQHGKKYFFDGVFGPNVKQLTMYETIVKPLIAEVLAGYNCTVFAYGQTGTGKTYTMAGGSACTADVSWQDNEHSGIIPRALAHLFDELRLIQQEYTVRVSYLELYNEELYDLLAEGEDTSRIRLFEDQRQKGSVIIQGVEEQTVHNKYEVYGILEKGQEKRRTASTLMNNQSSRSHTVFCITIHTRETTVEGEELVKTGKLNLVDLAGSENISRSGAVDLRAREAGNINQSLLNLGRVIKALVEKAAYIPYRASKLTRILQDSLGGRTKTSIIATISPATPCLDETLSTLEYANRARNITNRPEVNQRMSQKALLSRYVDEIERLRKDLSAARTGSGVYLATENYVSLINDKQMTSEELAEKVTIIRDLEQQLKKMEEHKELVEEQWSKLRTSFDETNKELLNYQNMVRQMTTEIEEHEYLVNCYSKNAETLHEQAQALLKTTKSSAFVEAALREKIEKLYFLGMSNTDAMKEVKKSVRDSCLNMREELSKFMHSNFNSNKRLVDTMKHIEKIQKNGSQMVMTLSTIFNEFKSALHSQQGDIAVWVDQLINRCNHYVNTVNEVQNWNSTQLSNYLEQIFDMEKEQHGELCNKLDDQLEEMSIAVSTLSRDVTTDLDKIKEELALELVKLVKSLNSQVSSSDDSMKQVVHWREEMQKALDSGFQIVQQQLLHSKNTDASSLLLAEAITNNMQTVIPTVSDKLQSRIDGAGNLISGLKTVVEASKHQRPALSFSEKIMSDFNAEKEVKEKLTKAQLLTITEDVKTCSEDFMQTNFELLFELKSALDAKLENVLSSTAESYAESNLRTKTVLKELANSNDKAVAHEESLSTTLTNVVNFVEKDMMEIKHSGDTPVRVRYNSPINLKQPSPKDRILLKFRQQKQLVESLNRSGDTESSSGLLLPTIEETLGQSATNYLNPSDVLPSDMLLENV